MLDLSNLVQGEPSTRGSFVCRLDDNSSCDGKVEYRYCVSRELWQRRLPYPLLEERFTFVAVDRHRDDLVLGSLAVPEMTALQIQGIEPLVLLGPLDRVSDGRSHELLTRLEKLDTWASAPPNETGRMGTVRSVG
jgi:hypothetical protein